MRGRVVDADGAPIAGGDVRLGRPGDTAGFEGETDENGCFDLGGLVAPGQRDYFLTVSSAGYEPSEGTVRSTGEYSVLVRLAAMGSAQESSFTVLPDETSGELGECFSNALGPQVGQSQPARAPEPRLPAFEDFPVEEHFTGEPAEVNLASHPNAKEFRTALSREAEAGAATTRFAGHYRIVVIGCGTSCKAVWAVDLEDGSLHELFTASVGVSFRPDSRLIIENDPAYYEDLLRELSVAEVEDQMETYGAPRFWVEKDGKFEPIGPQELHIDPATRKVISGPSAKVANRWKCSNDLEVQCTEGSCEATTGDRFTPMSVSLDDSGAMSVCAYSGCWEGTGRVIESEQFLVLIGHDLAFSTSRDLESGNQDIVIAIDRTDKVATLKAGALAQPLLCERVDGD